MADWILGLGGSSHDYSAALMHGNDIIVAIEEERISRVKYGLGNGFQNPIRGAIQYCLDYAGIGLDDIHSVVSSDLLPHRVRSMFAADQLTLYPHHLSHAASAWLLTSPGEEGGVIVYDGLGSVAEHPGPDMRAKRETFTFYAVSSLGDFTRVGGTYGEGFVEHTMFPMGYTNSVGQIYEIVNAAVGFAGLESGKTMGLAGWGSPQYLDEFAKHARIGDSLDSLFQFSPFDGFLEELQAIKDRDGDTFATHADLAATVQTILERVLLRGYELLRDEAPTGTLAIAGGCGLNTVANGVLAARAAADGRRVLIPPHSGDAGLSFGALYLFAKERDAEVQVTFRGKAVDDRVARPSKTYAADAARAEVRMFYPDLLVEPSLMSPEQLAARLADGEIIAVFEGSSEFGPRALGGRSILADPRKSMVRERINRQIKYREPFRPIAPLILDSEFSDYFEPSSAADPFMLKVAQATELCKASAPAVVHIDGGSRVQTVPSEGDSFLTRTLREFFAITGVPILVNTSFNRRGEPIVETPLQALRALHEMPLDGLWLEGQFVTRVPSHFPPAVR
ncbi:carbamoyltransferase C-terminal domain-containing protein [Paenarthrobacter sp. RAF54_2]|uniref:carbamoyltransferase C-terminal domain-containing protein n=2 Tax=unclassified Paenarthrobacter TaxID=2634190 RepID=UPI003F9A6C19